MGTFDDGEDKNHVFSVSPGRIFSCRVCLFRALELLQYVILFNSFDVCIFSVLLANLCVVVVVVGFCPFPLRASHSVPAQVVSIVYGESPYVVPSSLFIYFSCCCLFEC